MTKSNPSRYTGIPLRRNARTVKSAVHSINWGSRNSPVGTANNMNASGNMITRVAGTPSTASVAAASNATNANWVTTLTVATSPANHATPIAASGKTAQKVGSGGTAASSARRRQMSHNAIGKTRMPCAKVSERSQTPTIPSALSRYSSKITLSSNSNATPARCQDGTPGGWITSGASGNRPTRAGGGASSVMSVRLLVLGFNP